jgi:hypothetical protein
MKNTLSFVIEEAIKIGTLNYLEPKDIENMVKYTFTSKSMSPATIDHEYVAKHLPFILTGLKRRLYEYEQI